MTVGEIAALVGGRATGDPAIAITGVATLADAGPTQIALLASPRYRDQVGASRAGALLVSAGLEGGLTDDRPRVTVPDAHAALVPLLHRLHPAPSPEPGVHPTAVIGRGVHLGEGVEVGPHAVVGAGAVIGERTRVGPHVVVGARSRLGPDCVLHPQVTLYDDVVVGARVILHSGVRLGSDGFGYASGRDGHRKIPQVGRCVIEDDVEIGANACVDRGSIGDTVIGRGTKLDNLVHVGHNVWVGPHCVLTAQVGIAGSVRIGAGALIGGQVGISGHLTIGDRARIAGGSKVYQDIPPGASFMGTPAEDARLMRRAWTLVPRLPELLRRIRKLERGRSGTGTGDGEDPSAGG